MPPENITPETLGDGNAPVVNVPAPVKETVSTVPSQSTADSLSLAELNLALGKDYKDKESALKSFKDTFAFVGKRKEDMKPEIDANAYISRDQYESDMFYSKNAEYDKPEIRRVIDAIAKSEGIKPADVVKSDTFTAMFNKVKGYDESESTRSVLETSPQLASSNDAFKKAGEALARGDKDTAENLVAKAVLETMK
jgi:hypothetical protein